VKNTAVLALATMLGVGYLVFRAGESGFVAPLSSSGSSGSVAPSGGSMGGGAQRATLTFAPSSRGANPIVEPSGLPAWFVKSVETPLPKRFVGAIYMHQIEALRARGY
jgi:hypothetical protein